MANRKKSLLNIKVRSWYFILGLLIIKAIIFYPLLLSHSSRETLPYEQSNLLKKSTHLNNVYFIFLNGLGYYSDGSRFNNMGFEKIRMALAEAGFSFYDDRFLLYSYVGGEIIEGKWYPGKYTPKDTGQPIYLSVDRLGYLVEQFSLAHPEANFILVGHSLGGRIALDYVSATTPQNKQKIKGVITLNSPLLGVNSKVPEIIKIVLDYSDTIFASPAVKQLILEFNHEQELACFRRNAIKELQSNGLRVATFSTYQDWVVGPTTGCVMDEKGNPVTEGFVVNASKFSIKDIFSHMQILEHQEVMRSLIEFSTSLETIPTVTKHDN